MRAVSFVVCVGFLWFMDNVNCTLALYLGNLPSEIGNAFSSAWESIKEAIKTPVRIKRLGPGGRRKSTTTPPTTTASLSKWTPDATYPPNNENKLKLPLLPIPRWRTFGDWQQELRRPPYIQRRKVDNDRLEENVWSMPTRQPGRFAYDDWRRMQRIFINRSRRGTPADIYPAPGDASQAKAAPEYTGVILFM